MMNRQEYNYKIFNLLKFEDSLNEELVKDNLMDYFYEELNSLIRHYPDQRFGQIVCNYIFPNYNLEYDYDDDISAKYMGILFGNFECDPFFEESSATYKRLFEK